LRTRFRKPLLYPLSYGGACGHCIRLGNGRSIGRNPDALLADRRFDRPMTVDGRCAGSLETAPSAESGTAVCPVCGTRLPLGYAGRVPVHDVPPPEPAAPDAR
jgi:hypothetical protein